VQRIARGRDPPFGWPARAPRGHRGRGGAMGTHGERGSRTTVAGVLLLLAALALTACGGSSSAAAPSSAAAASSPAAASPSASPQTTPAAPKSGVMLRWEGAAQVELTASGSPRVLIDIQGPSSLSAPPTADDILLTTRARSTGEHETGSRVQQGVVTPSPCPGPPAGGLGLDGGRSDSRHLYRLLRVHDAPRPSCQRLPQPRVDLLRGLLLHVRHHSQAPRPIRTADSVKMIGQSRKGRNATLKPVNRDTSASARSVVIATA